MIHQCSIGELLTSHAYMHHDHEGCDALKHYAALKGLLNKQFINTPCNLTTVDESDIAYKYNEVIS